MSIPHLPLLETVGAKYDDHLGAYFESPFESSSEQAAIAIITRLGLLKVTGIEAEKFLQGQITADMAQVSEAQSALGCHCNVKGRALASFLIFKKADDYYLLMDRDLLPSLMDHWKKYIAFSKAEMANASEDCVVFGLINQLENLPLSQELLSKDNNSFATVQQSHFTLIGLQAFRDDALLVCNANDAEAIFNEFSQNRQKLGDNAWAQADINAGVASVMKDTMEQFIPLEMNYQWTDGISFTKGCYTGQEIVARLHYRGKQKQRLFKATFASDQLPELNGPIYSANSGDQAVGHIVNRAWLDSGKISILAILKIEQALTEELHVNEKNGPILEVNEVPYAITNE